MQENLSRIRADDFHPMRKQVSAINHSRSRCDIIRRKRDDNNALTPNSPGSRSRIAGTRSPSASPVAPSSSPANSRAKRGLSTAPAATSWATRSSGIRARIKRVCPPGSSRTGTIKASAASAAITPVAAHSSASTTAGAVIPPRRTKGSAGVRSSCGSSVGPATAPTSGRSTGRSATIATISVRSGRSAATSTAMPGRGAPTCATGIHPVNTGCGVTLCASGTGCAGGATLTPLGSNAGTGKIHAIEPRISAITAGSPGRCRAADADTVADNRPGGQAEVGNL